MQKIAINCFIRLLLEFYQIFLHLFVLQVMSDSISKLVNLEPDGFKKLVSSGTFVNYGNRICLAGTSEAGKSLLARILIGEAAQMSRQLTGGITTHTGRCGIDLHNKKMVPLKTGQLVQSKQKSLYFQIQNFNPGMSLFVSNIQKNNAFIQSEKKSFDFKTERKFNILKTKFTDFRFLV